MIANPSTHENSMLEVVEGQQFSLLYLKHFNIMLPLTTSDKLMYPTNASQQVQSYPINKYII